MIKSYKLKVFANKKKIKELNRHGELFRCVSCGHTGDADVIGAVNIKLRAERVAREHYVPLTSQGLERPIRETAS